MEHFNGVNSEVFNEDKDVDEFSKMVEKAKEENNSTGNDSIVDKAIKFFAGEWF